MAYQNYPKYITEPTHPAYQDIYKDFKKWTVVQNLKPKFATFGSIFIEGKNPEGDLPMDFREEIACVKVPPHEKGTVYLLHVGLTMLSARGGDFDEDDTVYADIFSIGGDPENKPDVGYVVPPDLPYGYGGVWGVHFDSKAGTAGAYHHRNMGISTYIGPLKGKDVTTKGDVVKFRLACVGDDWVGASYFVLELGKELPK